ncbi:sterol desaturase family protein [Roseibium sp.]|uniref:sterol desaturase family protein n=1 Tax=Roseibium sp. TaxID=1936156 RepID=UPI003D0EA2AA
MFPSSETFLQTSTLFVELASTEFMRYILAATGLHVLLNSGLRPLALRRRIRSDQPPKGQIRREILTSARSVLVFAGISLAAVWAVKMGWAQVHQDPDTYGWPYFFLSVAILIVGHDTWFYWIHRLLHDKRLYRRWHHLHHRSFKPTPFTAFAFNIGEAALHGLYTPLVILLLPVSYLALFLFSIHMIVRNTIGHCGVELFPSAKSGRPFFDWLTTVTHHDLHHASPNWNFGLYFTFWDRLMGTEHPDYLKHFAATRTSLSSLETVGEKSTARPILKRLGLGAAVMIAACLTSPSADADQSAAELERLSGSWVSEGYGAVVKLHSCNQPPTELCGTLIWIWSPQSQQHLGMKMLWGFRFDGSGWRRGEIAIPGKNQVFRSDIQMINLDTLQVKGCAVIVCKSQIWRRLDSLPHIGLPR